MNNADPVSMKGLPFTPLDPCWLLENAAFQAEDPKLVRAIVKLLFYAWQAQPAGSIPSQFDRIAGICGLDAIEVGNHYDALTEGWELRGDRLHHVKLSALCERLAARFGDTIVALAEQAAVLPQAPEEFELTAPAVESSKLKGRRLIPANFGMTPAREAMLRSVGYATAEDFDWILQKFVSHSKMRNDKWVNWDQAFQNFAMKEDLRRIPSARTALTPLVGSQPHGTFSSRAARYAPQTHGARGEQSVAHNMSKLRGEVPST